MAAPLPLLQLNPRGDQGSVDYHPTGGEQWVPLPGLAWFPASLFWFPARGWWPAGLCVTQSVTPTIPSLAMCTQPHLLLLRKSHCTARAPAHLNECSVSWWVLGCWAAPALWAPATTGLSDTLSPTPSLPSVTLVAPTGLPHTQRRPRMWAFSGLGPHTYSPVSVYFSSHSWKWRKGTEPYSRFRLGLICRLVPSMSCCPQQRSGPLPIH